MTAPDWAPHDVEVQHRRKLVADLAYARACLHAALEDAYAGHGHLKAFPYTVELTLDRLAARVGEVKAQADASLVRITEASAAARDAALEATAMDHAEYQRAALQASEELREGTSW
jgi:hypothetical protein